MRQYKVDTTFWGNLENLLNQRAREGWRVVHICNVTNPSLDLYYHIVWVKNEEQEAKMST